MLARGFLKITFPHTFLTWFSQKDDEIAVCRSVVYLQMPLRFKARCSSTGGPQAECGPPYRAVEPLTEFQNTHRVIMFGEKNMIFI